MDKGSPYVKEVDMVKRITVLFTICLVSTLALCSCVPPPSGGGGGGSSPSATGWVGGQILLPERVLLDSDTRDPGNAGAVNNSLALAQVIPNLVMVAGNVDLAVDPDDYFATSLNAGEFVMLSVGDTIADLDLYLYQGGVPVASSTGAGKSIESVNSPGAGSYQVRVRAVTGGSNYQLQIGTLTWSATGSINPNPVGEVVPGEVLVKVKTPVGAAALGDLRSLLHNRAEETARRHHAEIGTMTPHGVARLVFATGVAPGDVNERDEARVRTLAKVKELQSDPDVEYAEPNFIVRPMAIPNDTYWAKQWNLQLINLPQAWDLTIGSPTVIVAVVDTGVLYDHSDLAANILKDGARVVGYDMIASAASANDGDGPDSDPYDSGDQEIDSNGDGRKDQSSYHGTHVAGIIGAAGNNSQGIAGVAWNVKIMPVRVLGRNGGTTLDVSEGIRYAAGVSNTYGVYPQIGGVTTPADVINLSLGQPDYSQTLQDAINMARSAGVTVVAAAGNSAVSSNYYPAACTGVIGVSAVDYNGNLAPYSNFGTYVDLAAPGGDSGADLDGNGDPDGIMSTLAVGLNSPTSFNYVYYQGTSMAAPHISGVIALMKAAYYDLATTTKLTPYKIDSLIRGTVVGIDSITGSPHGVRDNNFGYGLIDARKAVLAAEAMATLPADLALDSTTVDFGFNTTTMNVAIINLGGQDLTGVVVSPYSSIWLSHVLSGSTLTLTANRAVLTDGNYQATLTINSDNGGSETLNVRVFKGASVTSGVGQIYVVLVNAQGKTVMISTTPADDYLYHFFRLQAGAYQIVAGTDLDNDGYIGDAGEFLGRYPSVGLPGQVNVGKGGVNDRNFILEPVTTASALRR